MTKHYCDKCGSELPLDVMNNYKIGLWIHYEKSEWTQEPYDAWENIHHDICKECAIKLEEFITGHSPTPVI